VRRRHAWGWALAAAALGVLVLFTLVAATVPWRSETLRKRIIEALSERLDSDVALSNVTLRAFPRLHAEGGTLLIRQHGRTDVPPLIAIRSFKVDAGLIGIWRRHVAHVEINGLDISIPPRDDEGATPVGVVDRIAPSSSKTGVIIDTVDASDARLIIIPRGKAKAPQTWKTWAIHTLRMHRVGIDESMPYQATLTNAVPPGEIQTAGDFGPWDRGDPGGTPLNGTFTFDNADLGVFKGVKGTLSSRGSFGGSLGWIDVNGETDTPNFVIDVGGHPFPLHATYHTIVDGTNGDTRLERIDATLVRSSLAARGAVLDAPPGTGARRGRTVELHIDMPKARIEDVLTMAVRAPNPPMVGALKLTTTFLLPPGDADVVDRLKLNGRFDISQARFANYNVQGKIVELSQRAQGKRPDRESAQVASNFRGRFVLERGVLTLSDLSFDVPGAQVKLAGRYALERETIDFKGDLLMSAKVSQTVRGFKSLLLKIVDPLFRGPGGGSSIPIAITGTRSDPRFGIDLHRVFKR
jgi:hypothetical protein